MKSKHSYIVILPLVIVTFLISASLCEDDANRQAYLAKRAKERAVAEKTVKDLSARDDLMAGEYIRLALAYNELGEDRLALDAICGVPDEVLAKNNRLDVKATCFHNVNFGQDKSNLVRELAFIDRCLDKKYGNQGVWLCRKAKVICQSSVAPAIATIGDMIGSDARIIDREQYEYAFELLERAFALEPNLVQVEGELYRDRHFIVDGKVIQRESSLRVHYIYLEGNGPFTSVRCAFPKSESVYNELASLHAGKRVSISGRGNGVENSTVMIVDCALR